MKQATETTSIGKERKPFLISTIELGISDQKVISVPDNPPGYNDIWTLYNTGAIFKNGIIMRLIKMGKCKILNIKISSLLVNITTNQCKKYKNTGLANEEVNKTDPNHNLLLFHYHKTDTRSYFTVSGFGPLYKEDTI